MTQGTSNEAQEALSVIAFCGPNGSGKSTITAKVLSDPETNFQGEYINADDIAKTLEKDIPDYNQRNLRAAQIAEEKRIDALKAGRAFAFETVMSTPEKVALMTQAKASGYSVSLVFVTTDDPEKNVQRVANRVNLGGHPVDPDKIRERYHSAMNLLACAVEHSDFALVVDNSHAQPLDIAIKEDGKLILKEHAQEPAWVKEKLANPYQAREQSRNEIGTVLDGIAVSQGAPVLKEADASNGKQYTGKIVGLTDYHALQQTGANVFYIHDRSLTATKELQLGKSATVQYAYDKGKILAVVPTKDRAKGIER